MASFRSNGLTFLLGVAAGVVLTHPEIRNKARPLFRKALVEGARLKLKVEKMVAASGEDLEDFMAGLGAAAKTSESDDANGSGQPIEPGA